jgi:glycosyltransferase involved in cell wall biosynthesis
MPPGLARSGKFAGLHGAFVQRCVRRVAPEFDVMIGGYGPGNFSKPGIQYISDFSFMYEWRTDLDPAVAKERTWWYGDTLLRRCYTRLCHAVHAPKGDAWRRNRTLAISGWCTKVLKERLCVEAETLYPPVTGAFPYVPWEKRENGFVCIGRVVPEKRMDAVIRILEKVRENGHNVHLHILGGLDDSPFGAKIRAMAASRKWVSLEGRTFGPKKIDLIAGHRFAINGRENEPFGIAPAETVKGGCITFVPNSGGQVEIVNHPALTFSDDDDAVKKICAVLSGSSLQETLRRHLAAQSRLFTVENFQAGLRRIVFEFLSLPIAQRVNDGRS